MRQSIKISEETYQRILETKPEGMNQIDYVECLVDRGMDFLKRQEEMEANQREILYKLRQIWKIIHPAPTFKEELEKAKNKEEREALSDKMFDAYLENLEAGRREQEYESGNTD